MEAANLQNERNLGTRCCMLPARMPATGSLKMNGWILRSYNAHKKKLTRASCFMHSTLLSLVLKQMSSQQKTQTSWSSASPSLNVSHEEYQNAFQQLGESWTMSPDGTLFKRIERFTCQMYVPSTPVADVNEMRHHLFIAKKGNVESSALPPCRDCLHLHVKQANYQAGIWRGCLQNDPQVPSPVDAGWKLDEDGNLSITWLQSPPAPATVLELLTCSCSRSCTLPSCTCIAHGLNCTDMCKLKDCSNRNRRGSGH
uniref:Tesmin/TSO1-like CXC domain-containing protein n=1 Tax=Branchiostoma floridae TaxID=7739 RepID=C3Y4T8_BRAFL|eukprot:XP_002608735.1 hypothetical protein BRAFLDRAFT_73956 [Branchiostoma floridae]